MTQEKCKKRQLEDLTSQNHTDQSLRNKKNAQMSQAKSFRYKHIEENHGIL